MKKVLQIFLLMLSLSSWSFADVQSQIAQLDKEDKVQITILLQEVETQINKYLFSGVNEVISQAKDLIVDKDDESRIALMENKVIDKQKIYDIYTKTISSIDSSNYNDSFYQQLKSMIKDSNDKALLTKIDGYYNKSGFNKLGYNISGYDKSGRDKDGYDRNGFKDGYDKSGRDKNGYDRNGYDKSGFDSSGWNSNKINKTTKTKYDSNNYDYYGYDKQGYDSNGWNSNKINKTTGTQYNSSGYDYYGKSKKIYTASSSYATSKKILFAHVTVDVTAGLFGQGYADRLELSGGPSYVNIEESGNEDTITLSTYDSSKELSGTYYYTIYYEDNIFSGTVYINGKSDFYTIRIYNDGKFIGIENY